MLHLPLSLLLASGAGAFSLGSIGEEMEDAAGAMVDAAEDAAEEISDHFASDEDEAEPAAGEGEPGQYSALHETKECPELKGRKSDRCRAGNDRDLRVYFELPGEKGKKALVFGANDKAGVKSRFKKTPTHIVIHNGGSAKRNRDWWQGRRTGAHYTVNRDGKVFQHYGEEFVAVHANLANPYSIGIELETVSVKVGKKRWHCNSLHKARLNKHKLRNPEDLDYARKACSPTDAQYASLKALIGDIARRHGITVDADHLIGHCEAPGKVHGDPRAFDWDKVGVSKADKNALFKTKKKMRYNCTFYEPS